MKQRLLAVILLTVSFTANSSDRRYELRVDGLACPYCAYGIEKKIKALDGVDFTSVEVKLNDGLVLFQADTPEPFTEASLKTLINDAGFTLKSMETQSLSNEAMSHDFHRK